MLQRLFILIGWLLCLFIMGVVVYVQYEDVQDGVKTSRWNTVKRTAYETLSRDAWAVALAWIVYACNCGYGGESLIGDLSSLILWVIERRVILSSALTSLSYPELIGAALSHCSYHREHTKATDCCHLAVTLLSPRSNLLSPRSNLLRSQIYIMA